MPATAFSRSSPEIPSVAQGLCPETVRMRAFCLHRPSDIGPDKVARSMFGFDGAERINI